MHADVVSRKVFGGYAFLISVCEPSVVEELRRAIEENVHLNPHQKEALRRLIAGIRHSSATIPSTDREKRSAAEITPVA